MSGGTAEFVRLRGMTPARREEWARRIGPGDVSIHGWVSLLDSAETELVAPLRLGGATDPAAPDPAAPDPAAFEFAAWLADLGPRLGVASDCQAADRRLRLAEIALRYPRPVAGLPEALTPDGAARRAIAAIPFDEREAAAVARRRNRLLDEDPDGPPVPRQRDLQDLEWMMPALEPVRAAIVDPRLAAEVAHWLTVYESLAPPRSPS